MRTRQLALLLAAAPLLFGQMKESVTVEVIDVPVYVSTAKGPVRDLTKENFELFVNGKRQPIEYFDVIDFSAAARAQQAAATTAPAPRDPRERRLFVLFFDLVFTQPPAVDRARKAAVQLIDQSSPSDYFAVVTFTTDRGAEFITPFTNDHAVARRAAMALSLSESRDPLALAISPGERTVVTGYTLADGERIGDVVVGTLRRETADLGNRSAPVKRMIEDQIYGFDTIATRLAQIEGYKHVIVLSEGINPGLVYSNPYSTDNEITRAMDAMLAAFRRANAVVDTLDLGSTQRDAMRNDVLRLMAHETGGQFISHAVDIVRSLKQVSSTSEYGYRLGFALPRNAKNGENRIEVKLKNVPGSPVVNFRRGFSTVKAQVAADDGLRLADIILNDIPQSGIAPAIAFRARPFIDVDVPAAALANGPAVVLLYVFNAKGEVVEFKQRNVPAPGTARGKLELPSGAYVVKVLLRSGDSVGFAKQAFVIP